MEIDINRSCRSCLCESNGMHPICESANSCENFGTVDRDSCMPNMSIAEVIMACTIVNISPDDGLPQSVCSKCLHQIQQVFQFKQTCEASDLQLRHYSLNRADPISCVKTENDEMVQLFHPETILVTKFGDDSDFDDDDDEPTVSNIVKCEKNQNEGRAKAGTKIKIEQLPSDVDEKALIEQAEIVDGRFQCKFCEKTLADRQTYKLHIRLHTGTNLKRCAICDRGFAKKNHLERHLATHPKTHKCKSCTKAFLTTDERKEHEKLCKKTERKESNQVKEEGDETPNVPPKSGPLTDCKEEVLNEIKELSEHDEDSVDKSDVQMTKSLKTGEIRQRNKIPLDDEEQRLIKSAKVENNRYECPLCSKTLSRQELLLLHIRTTHTGKNLLRCAVCDKGFAKPYNLNRHMLLHDSENNVKMDETIITKALQPDGSYSCVYCTKVFIERQSFRVHLRMHSVNTLNQCDICNESFAEEKELMEHMAVHGNCFPCKECGEVFKTFMDRKDHTANTHTKTKNVSNAKKPSRTSKKQTTHETDDEDEQLVNSAELFNGRYRCKFCEKTLANRNTLKLHIRLHLQKKLKICELCGHGYSKKSHLDRHMKSHFPKKPECQLCHGTFESIEELKLHKAADHKDETIKANALARPHKCDMDLCAKSFHTEQRLKEHRLRHFQDEKRFACDICDKRFRRYDNLRTHMRCHIPPHEREAVAKTHLCSHCGQGFSNSSNLNSHVRTHTGEKPFKCDICSSRFRRSCDLICHRRTHTGEKPYPCLVCGHRFSRSNKLIRHMRIHTGEKPYKCTECDRAFTQSNDLTLHIRRHTGDKPFPCICGDRFITNSLLKQHRRTNGH